MRASVLVSLAFTSLLTLQVATAQRFYQHYGRGLEAIEKEEWQKAIEELEAAIEKDPRPDDNKRMAGVRRNPYFPYYYLGLAYYGAGDLVQAETNFSKALDDSPLDEVLIAQARSHLDYIESNRVDPAFQKLVAEARQAFQRKDLRDALEKAQQAQKTEPEVFEREGLLTLLVQIGGSIDQWKRLLSSARASLESGDLESSEAILGQANAIYPGQPEWESLIDELRNRKAAVADRSAQTELAERSTEFDEILGRARAAYAELRLDDALRLYNESSAVDRERFDAEQLDQKVAEIRQILADYEAAISAYDERRWADSVQAFGKVTPFGDYRGSASLVREAQSMIEFEEGRRLSAAGQYADAEEQYQRALELNSNNENARSLLEASQTYSDLVERAKELSAAGNMEETRRVLTQARMLGPTRFGADQEARSLFASLRRIDEPEEKTDLAGIKAALVALFSGRIDESISALQTQRAQDEANLDIQAYLGVAYAASAYLATNQEESEQLIARAREQFRQVIATRPDYELSPRLVSPRILELFRALMPGG